MNERGHLSTETLDLLSLSALAAAEVQKAQVHLGTCAPCKRRWEELTEDKLRFEQFVFPRTLPKVEARAQRDSPWTWLSGWTRLGLPAAGLVAAALLAFVVLPRPQAPYLGIKGGPGLRVVARRGDAQFEVRAGAHLRAKDQIRFVVEPGGAHYLLLASRDGRGALSVYYPYGGVESGAVEGPRQELPGSIELDDAAGPERLVALFSDAPLRWEEVRPQLVAPEGKVALPGLRETMSLEFVKDAP
jgi:hypothetical protein